MKKTKTLKESSKGRKIRIPKKFISTDDSTDDNHPKIAMTKRKNVLATMEEFLNNENK